MRAFIPGLVVATLAVVSPCTAGDEPPTTYAREVKFKLTFAKDDLIWLGDPASPTAQVFIRPGALPIARDAHIRTLTTTWNAAARRYMREARVFAQGAERVVHAFTSQTERPIGKLDAHGRFHANEFYRTRRDLLPTWPPDPATLHYDQNENALFYDMTVPGPVVTESLDFLPLAVRDRQGIPLTGLWSIDVGPAVAGAGPPSGNWATVSLIVTNGRWPVVVATADVPAGFARENVQLESFDNQAGTYVYESAHRAGGAAPEAASATFTVAGTFAPTFRGDVEALTAIELDAQSNPPAEPKSSQSLVPQLGVKPLGFTVSGGVVTRETNIAIDGSFDDWRNIPGVDDPRGDAAPYLEYVPDVDLLEFKVAHDKQHIYLYARVAGQVGRTHPQGGRSYFYAYMDVDQNAQTGFLPTRDDDCYFGVDVGDDCEVQFEFVDSAFRKSFYGFCGLGGDRNVLEGVVTLGKSQYGRLDELGKEREHYKSEYIFRNGKAEITEDLKLGTSDSISIAVSPDGSQVEIASTFAGFLKNRQGQPTLRPGQTIDIAAGMECDSKAYVGKTRWAADSTPAIRGYRLDKK